MQADIDVRETMITPNRCGFSRKAMNCGLV
jgi:hypothetical protein